MSTNPKTEGTYWVPGLAQQTDSTQPNSDTKPWISGKHIIVAGAGISGLSFAIALAQQFPADHPKPTLVVYERDTKENRIGREGYSLSLRTDIRSGGVQILDRLGLYESCKEVSVTHAGAMHIWNRTFDDSLLKISVGPVGEKGLLAMRIRRNALQKVLADKAELCGWKIVWGVGVVGVVRNTSGMRVELSTGEAMECDLLVAADGSRSKVRAVLRPDDKLDYAGVVMMTGTGKFSSPEEVPEPVNTNWGLVLGGGGTGLFVSPVERESALWALSYYSPSPKESLRHPLSKSNEGELIGKVRMMAKAFDPKVAQLVEATDPTTLMQFSAHDRPPFPHEPSKDGNVVWLGDANHAVSPYAGNGANMAIMDGWDLAMSLSRAESLETALVEYDKKFIPRSKNTLTASRWGIDVAHATGVKLWLYTLLSRVLRFFFVRGKA
jgi:2-polyprenyl-6-methoxyphenol hydroxylase-like FAD-dependent oxidoreductase